MVVDEAKPISDAKMFDILLKENGGDYEKLARSLFIRLKMKETEIGVLNSKLDAIIKEGSKLVEPLKRDQILVVKSKNTKDLSHVKKAVQRIREQHKPMVLFFNGDEELYLLDGPRQLRTKRDRSG